MPKHSFRFEAIGTTWSVETDREIDERLKTTVLDRIEVFDKTYSRFRYDSLVKSMSERAGVYAFPEDASKLFDFYDHLYEVTKGKVTPLIGGVLEKAGYDTEYSFVSKRQSPVLSWDEAVVRDNTMLETKTALAIDVGAAGKGYLVDLVCELLDEAGIKEYVVDASGDLRHKGNEENIVGLEHPLDPTKVIGAINVMNKSLCASAVNRRQWGDGVHHLFDPDSLRPTKDIIASWVIADTTMLADGIATSLFFVDSAVLQKSYSFEYVRMHSDGAIDYSPAFEGNLFV